MEELNNLCVLDNFVEDNVLQDLINREESIPKLCQLLKWKYERIERNLSQRSNFKLSRILSNKEIPHVMKKEALKWGILIQETDEEFIKFLKWFDEQLDIFISSEDKDCSELYFVAEIFAEAKHKVTAQINVNKFKIFLFELTESKLNSEHYTNLASIFIHYLDEIAALDSDFLDHMVDYLIGKENFDFLCILFNERLSELAKGSYFVRDEIWICLKNHINDGDSIKKKQALYILYKSVEYLKLDNSRIIPEVLRIDSFEVWDLYFTLLDISKEKQLHLIQPTLKLLSSITNLHMMWRLCLYEILLNHSQLCVVYQTVEHLLQLKFDDYHSHPELLTIVLIALNKYEYSSVSLSAFDKLSNFFIELDKNSECDIFFEEFLKIDWNPAAAWCILKSASPILNKIPHSFISKIMNKLRTLPHTFIRYSCVFLFLLKVFENRIDDILEDIVQVGHILLFTDVEDDEELFWRIVMINKERFQASGTELEEKLAKSFNGKEKKNLHTCVTLMNILGLKVDVKIKYPFSSITDIVLAQFPELRDGSVISYLFHRTDSIDNDYRYFSKYWSLIISYKSTRASMKAVIDSRNWVEFAKKCQCDEERVVIVMQVLAQSRGYIDKLRVDLKQLEYLKVLKNLKNIFYKWLLRGYRSKLRRCYSDELLEELAEQFNIVLDSDDEKSLYHVLENLKLLTTYASTRKLVSSLYIYDRCLKQICLLPSALLRSYAVVFFQNIFHSNLFSRSEFINYFVKWYSENLFQKYFLDCDIVMRVILEGCRKLILLRSPNVEILVPLMLVALLGQSIVQKNQRVEYGICQDIHRVIGRCSSIRNPNFIAMEVKMLAMESLYLLAKFNYLKNILTVDKLIEMILDIYKTNYKARYFPDSKIHFEKLRIAQLLLLLVKSTNNSKDQLVKFILDCFSKESHQPSVKQLLQWLLIILASSDSSVYLGDIIESINTSNRLHPSSVVTLMPVLYHLVLSSKDDRVWFEVTEALLPWTMGANFKLRVYSQVTFKLLFKKADETQRVEYTRKYSFLENTISNVLESTGNAVEETLKYDLAFIESFDPNLHYSVENIFIILPKILDVPPFEWENIQVYKFSEKFDIVIKNDHKLPDFKINRNEENVAMELAGKNLQTKIIPWKSALQENIENKTLGDLICVASLIDKMSNLGGLSRTCEVFSIKQLVLHNVKIKDDKEFKSLSMSSENWVNFMEVKKQDLQNFLGRMKESGYAIVALEQTSESVKLNEYRFERKTVLVLGNEKEGIPAPLLPLMDCCVEIPQFGQTRSLNVHVAAATFVWEYVRQHVLH